MSATSNAGAIINVSPRPRLLVSGFEGDEELVDQILATCPTARKVANFTDVRQAEWDVLVTTQPLLYSRMHGGVYRLEPHLSVIYVAPGNSYFTTIESRPEWGGEIRNEGQKISQEIRRVRGLPERIATLVHEKLEPVLMGRLSHTLFGRSYTSRDSSVPDLEPFITTPEGDILAGRYKRSENSEAWVIPHDTPDLIDWVNGALAEWHSISPERFPGLPDWSQQPEWMTFEERDIASKIVEVGERRRKVLADLAARESELKEQLSAAVETANGSARALLTSQSDALKEAVIDALRALGFTVYDADESAAPDDHLEDLHIKDPDRLDWIALGEVKGYARGAKTEGMTQFLRFNMRYVARTKDVPNANWYIVNQFMNRDPSTRQKVLHGKDEDVEAFGAANGLVIDTVELFKLLLRVTEGVVTSKEARCLLMESTGRFTFRV
ncbi:hypothetical protein AB0I97_16420 [Streptomyces sp. NPDC049951]|uniref:hypothetical protein n=1 Tax=Streptomyces sp. NPDC049951 TaxID=3156660 RepID=UPI00342869A7